MVTSKEDEILKSIDKKYSKIMRAFEDVKKKAQEKRSASEIEYLSRELDKTLLKYIQKYQAMIGHLTKDEEVINKIKNKVERFQTLRSKLKKYKNWSD